MSQQDAPSPAAELLTGSPDPALKERSQPTPARGRRALMTWCSGLIYSAITITLGFVTTPLLLRYLGEDRLGATRAAAEWFSYILLADLGFGGTIAALLFRAKSASPESIWSTARLGIRLQTLCLLLLVPGSLVLAWFMPSLINVPPELHRELRVASLLSVAGILTYPLNVYRLILEVSQRGYLINLGLAGHSLIWTGTAVTLAWLGWGLIGQSIAAVAAGLAFGIFAVAAARFAFGRHRPPIARISASQLWSEAWPISLNSVARRLQVSSDMILVGAMMNASAVTMLFVTQRLQVLAAGQVNSIANASWAGLAEMRRAGEHASFERRICEVLRLMLGLNLAIGGAVAALNPHFVRLWVGDHLYAGHAVTLATLAVSVMLGVSALFTLLMDLSGDARRRTPIALTSGVLKVATAVVLIRLYGLVGGMLAHAAAWLFTEAWWYARVLVRVYGVASARLLRTVASSLAAGGFWALACLSLVSMVPAPSGWLNLATLSFAVGAATAAYCWFAVLSRTERAEWWTRLRGHSSASAA